MNPNNKLSLGYVTQKVLEESSYTRVATQSGRWPTQRILGSEEFDRGTLLSILKHTPNENVAKIALQRVGQNSESLKALVQNDSLPIDLRREYLGSIKREERNMRDLYEKLGDEI